MKIEVTSITTVRTMGTDCVYLNTTLPNGVWPFTGTATIKMEVARGQSEKYVADNFPDIPHKVIEG